MPEISMSELREILCQQPAKTPCGSAPSSAERAVLVTTEFRGVFFGYAKDTSGDTINLARSRNCIWWSKDVGGFLGLANVGPSSQCRIGPRADIELRKITAVAEVSPAAVAMWEGAPCYKG